MDINVFAKFDEIPSLHVQDIKEYLYINKIYLELQRTITLTELAPTPYFSVVNIHLVDINVFAKFEEIPSLPGQDITNKSVSSTTQYPAIVLIFVIAHVLA